MPLTFWIVGGGQEMIGKGEETSSKVVDLNTTAHFVELCVLTTKTWLQQWIRILSSNFFFVFIYFLYILYEYIYFIWILYKFILLFI